MQFMERWASSPTFLCSGDIVLHLCLLLSFTCASCPIPLCCCLFYLLYSTIFA